MDHRKKRLLSRLAALSLGLVAASVLLEIGLRIANPVTLRLRGKEIVLPVSTTEVARNAPSTKLDEEIVNHRNSLGFRGAEPPADFESAITVVTVGGSTTECVHLTEGRTWPDRLGARLSERIPRTWVNNAGLDGHSTFGHIHLVDQYLLDLAPDYLVFLVGVNDVNRDEPNQFDLRTSPRGGPWEWLVRHSELLSTIAVVRRSMRARDLGVGHIGELDLARPRDGADDPGRVEKVERRLRNVHLPSYRERLELLVDMTRGGGIEPILVTQPALYGDATDPTTGIAMGAKMDGEWTAAQRWRMLEWYNEVTREVGRERAVLTIDLARELPKDSALYYDWIHFGNRGAEAVADVLAAALIPFLLDRHPPPGSTE